MTIVSVEMIGQTLSRRYRLDSVLGQGGMGTVYGAVDLNLGREVAIKMIREEFLSRSDIVTGFIREAKIIAQLGSNPHILTLFDLSATDDGNPFIVYERLRGRSLKAIIREAPSSARSWTIEVGIQVALALTDVHDRGIVHSDLKPGNIFIVETSAIPLLAKLIDFGISQSPLRAVSSGRPDGSVAGTPAYVAPEVLAGNRVSTASDIYSFGVTLYELATGIHPYPTNTLAETIVAHTSATASAEPLIEKRLPPSFRALISDMLEKDCHDRPSAAECLAALWRADKELNDSKGR